jgi:hypothetical protein
VWTVRLYTELQATAPEHEMSSLRKRVLVELELRAKLINGVPSGRYDQHATRPHPHPEKVFILSALNTDKLVIRRPAFNAKI